MVPILVVPDCQWWWPSVEKVAVPSFYFMPRVGVRRMRPRILHLESFRMHFWRYPASETDCSADNPPIRSASSVDITSYHISNHSILNITIIVVDIPLHDGRRQAGVQCYLLCYLNGEITHEYDGRNQTGEPMICEWIWTNEEGEK